MTHCAAFEDLVSFRIQGGGFELFFDYEGGRREWIECLDPRFPVAIRILVYSFFPCSRYGDGGGCECRDRFSNSRYCERSAFVASQGPVPHHLGRLLASGCHGHSASDRVSHKSPDEPRFLYQANAHWYCHRSNEKYPVACLQRVESD